MTDGRKPPVFVVDDDAAARDSLGVLLESAGLTVETFASALDFLDAYDPSAPACLALDVRMPDIDGLEALRRLRAMPADQLKVIMITGHGDIDMAVAAMKAGAADFIEKPFDDEQFLERVQTLVAETAELSQRHQSDTETRARLAELTPRERDVLDQVLDGHPNKVIAYNLGISARTVEIHRGRVMQKMQARTLSQLLRMVLRAGVDSEADG